MSDGCSARRSTAAPAAAALSLASMASASRLGSSSFSISLSSCTMRLTAALRVFHLPAILRLAPARASESERGGGTVERGGGERRWVRGAAGGAGIEAPGPASAAWAGCRAGAGAERVAEVTAPQLPLLRPCSLWQQQSGVPVACPALWSEGWGAGESPAQTNTPALPLQAHLRCSGGSPRVGNVRACCSGSADRAQGTGGTPGGKWRCWMRANQAKRRADDHWVESQCCSSEEWAVRSLRVSLSLSCAPPRGGGAQRRGGRRLSTSRVPFVLDSPRCRTSRQPAP